MKLFICKSCKNNGCTYMGTDTLINPCEDYVPTKMTNDDKIRAMTDEELAHYAHDKGWCRLYELCPPGRDKCYECWLEWLKQEVQDAVD